MTDNNAAGFQREGGPAFPTEPTAEETAAASQADKDTGKDKTQSAEGGSSRTDTHQPFNEHPRWKQREDEWNSRFNDQEKRHQDDLKSIREEFATARKENKEQTKIPAWFGGTKEQWDAYRADRDTELTQAEERAENRAYERITKEKGAESSAVKDATEFMKSELAAIESDQTLNPTGAKIDPQALLKIVLDNELIDSKQRWNYRAGFKLMMSQQKPASTAATQEKKKIAASTNSDAGGEKKESPYKTSADFKKKRPW